MKIRSYLFPAVFLLVMAIVVSCEKKTEEFMTEPLTDYVPMQVGNHIIYRMDSTVFTNLNTTIEIHKYQVKHEVDAATTDNLGRPSYRIITYLRDSAGTTAWTPNGSYLVTITDDQVEVLENNFRYIKLHAPIKANYTWKGNTHFPTDPYESLCRFNSFDNLWEESDYFYDGGLSETETVEDQTYNDVWTVQQEDITDNSPIYSSRIYGNEKYAKGIGLVFREHILWEYQPPSSLPTGVYCGFGIKMWMIQKNF